MRTNFFCTNFLNTPRAPGHPGKIPGTSQIPLFETQGRQTFQGEHELFSHHPFAWKTPTPPGGLQTQKVNLCDFFKAWNQMGRCNPRDSNGACKSSWQRKHPLSQHKHPLSQQSWTCEPHSDVGPELFGAWSQWWAHFFQAMLGLHGHNTESGWLLLAPGGALNHYISNQDISEWHFSAPQCRLDGAFSV